MLDKAENNCYNHHSEIQKGTNSNLPYTFGMSRQCVCGPALTALEGALWNVTVCKGANSNELIRLLLREKTNVSRNIPER